MRSSCVRVTDYICQSITYKRALHKNNIACPILQCVIIPNSRGKTIYARIINWLVSVNTHGYVCLLYVRDYWPKAVHNIRINFVNLREGYADVFNTLCTRLCGEKVIPQNQYIPRRLRQSALPSVLPKYFQRSLLSVYILHCITRIFHCTSKTLKRFWQSRFTFWYTFQYVFSITIFSGGYGAWRIENAKMNK